MNKKEAAMKSRTRILNAAIHEFGEKGYKQGSTNVICERLNISKGIIFYHFGSKEQLFMEAAKRCMEEFDTYMRKNFIKGDTPSEGIRGCCLKRKDFFTLNPGHLRIFGEIQYNNDEYEGLICIELRKLYEKHTYDIIDQILEDVELNTRISREENIWLAVRLVELIDLEVKNRYQKQKKEGIIIDSTIEEQLLDEQMQDYEGYLDALLYGILKR